MFGPFFVLLLFVPHQPAGHQSNQHQVSRYNIEKLRKVVKNGPDVHPGANQVRFFCDGLLLGRCELSNPQRWECLRVL